MKTARLCTIALVSVAVWTLGIGADEKPATKATPKNAGFEKIKALAGEWEVTPAAGKAEVHDGSITYKVTAGGSAVLETLFPGTPHEMVTTYYLDGDDLALTHYCMLHNRPHMRAEAQAGADKLIFKCKEGDKIEKEDHMGQVTFTFIDADHFKTEWVMFKGGKVAETASFDLKRKQK
ncbi:MAG TPA: hypothetical protein VGZ47_00505 [Gemmataceae bacterium]|jgi:hypothetical protein|nr:hypothetical protein [Gemmataceae bacterium]